MASTLEGNPLFSCQPATSVDTSLSGVTDQVEKCPGQVIETAVTTDSAASPQGSLDPEIERQPALSTQPLLPGQSQSSSMQELSLPQDLTTVYSEEAEELDSTELGGASGGPDEDDSVNPVQLDINSVLAPSSSSQAPMTAASVLEMFSALTLEIRKGFAESSANQLEFKNYCESLDNKIEGLTIRTGVLEETVGIHSVYLDQAKEDIKKLTKEDLALSERMESLENNARRGNIRILNVPEGSEGSDIKQYIVSLLKEALSLEYTPAELSLDIQRVHRDPFKLNPQRSKPRKILVNFHTYVLKERILNMALTQKSLSGKGFTFLIRSDLSRITLEKQWEFGRPLDAFRKLGATAQLMFPAALKVMHNNKMYNIRSVQAADELLMDLGKGACKV
ncbi:uncharacterized protein LOC144773105 [Lissotriton helveticus]